jgi:hypothetical protein
MNYTNTWQEIAWIGLITFQRNKNINNNSMKLKIFTILFTIAIVSPDRFFGVHAVTPLPDISTLIRTAFPPWNIDANEKRISGGGKWNPLYLTKRWNGLDPAKGGYPTDTDTRYPFYFAAQFFGQPGKFLFGLEMHDITELLTFSHEFCWIMCFFVVSCLWPAVKTRPGAGGSRHCPRNAPDNHPIQTCPKVTTGSDDDPLYGPGHIPPHISLSVVRRAYAEGDNIADWFDFKSKTPCDIKKDKLLALVRRYYPRDPITGAVEYPPPKTPGTVEYYELEFPSETGSPHYCTTEYLALNQDSDFCPYIFEGPNRGKYRHPHIALASLQQYLANRLNPTVCGKEWEDYGKYPANPDMSVAFCEMESDALDAQPVIPYKWPLNGDRKIKNVPGLILWTPPTPSHRRGKENRRLQ